MAASRNIKNAKRKNPTHPTTTKNKQHQNNRVPSLAETVPIPARGGEPTMREPCEVHLSGQKAHGQVGPPSLKSFILIGDERVSASVAKLSAFLF